MAAGRKKWTHPLWSLTRTRTLPLPFQYKRSLKSNTGKMFLWDTSSPSSQSAGFLDKASIPCPSSSSLDLLACCVASSMSSVTDLVLSASLLLLPSPWGVYYTWSEETTQAGRWSACFSLWCHAQSILSDSAWENGHLTIITLRCTQGPQKASKRPCQNIHLEVNVIYIHRVYFWHCSEI